MASNWLDEIKKTAFERYNADTEVNKVEVKEPKKPVKKASKKK